MGSFLGKCLKGELDINDNNIPDNKEVVLMIENYLKKKNEEKRE